MIQRSRFRALVAMGAVYLAASTSVFAGDPCDPTEGADIYTNKCAICHSVIAGQNGAVGPSLFGVFGRIPGTAPDFTYSAAIKTLQEPWSAARLDWFLQDPPGRVTGTYMAFSGLRNDAARAAVICYLQSLHT